MTRRQGVPAERGDNEVTIAASERSTCGSAAADPEADPASVLWRRCSSTSEATWGKDGGWVGDGWGVEGVRGGWWRG